MERLDTSALQDFLCTELKKAGFDHPIAVYLKIPFQGAASPPKQDNKTGSARRAVHIDSESSQHLLVWQRIRWLLKSPSMRSYTNWHWKLFPAFNKNLDAKTQRELQTAIAKQNLVDKFTTVIRCNAILDPDSPLGVGTLRTYLLSLKTANQYLILGIDRDLKAPGELLFSTGVKLRNELQQFVDFLPITLVHTYGTLGRGLLSSHGLVMLDDQYWDEEEDRPGSRFSDDLYNEHTQDDGDIVIILENLPDSLADRPSELGSAFQPDEITHASFTTQVHQHRHLASPVSPPPRDSPSTATMSSTTMDSASQSRIRELETERDHDRNRIAQLEANMSTLLSSLRSGSPPEHSGARSTHPPHA